ncbi:MAG: transcription-repair coupling factor [Lachnospiraceae bacterium]|nr:transcription-repair coupling factor [Lachnospiraceae bacterium]
MKALFSPLENLSDFQSIRDVLKRKKNKGIIALSGCVDAQKLHLMRALSADSKITLIVTYDDIKARELYEEYLFYDSGACFFPAKDLIFFQADIHGNELTRERVSTLRRLYEGDKVTIVTTYAALMNPVAVRAREESCIELPTGIEINTKKLSRDLVSLGYEKLPQVEGPGQFSVRGDIIDIFDLTEENPYRIELWGDNIESIRSFDVLTQRSMENLEEVCIYPATEFILSDDELRAGIERICAEGEKQEKKLRDSFKTEEAHRLSKIIGTLKEEALELGLKVNLESYIKYFYEDNENAEIMSLPQWISEITGKKAFIFLEEPARLKEQAEAVRYEFTESYKHRLEMGYCLPGQLDLLYSGEEIADCISGCNAIAMSTLAPGMGYFEADYKYDIGARNIASYNGSFEALSKDLEGYRKKKYSVLLLSPSRTRAKRLAEEIRNMDIPAAYSEDEDREIAEGEVLVSYGRISKGFEYPLIKFVVLAETDIFGAERRKKRRRKVNLQGTKISSLEDLKPGDYVVHEVYGLGIYKGIEKVESDHIVRDYIRLEYKDGGVLYVLATELDEIQKYASADAEKVPKINKLGTKEWERTKSKVRTAVDEIAQDLVELYAKRQQTEGFMYGKDTVWQQEFEEMFPYEETEDQKAAIADTKADMESRRIMDRLICGDVGFGKTEIAIRAAFKAVQENKQVAYLVPTTILAQQHYNTFVQRMKDFPVRVELLSRFRTASEIKKVVEDLRKGQVDIVIGTHRLLSKDVTYKDLGLLIIDEEQRFGVGHKEKIKKLRENIDVLTLSATPIPRTLHMSLVGIRDMSLLTEAPNDRLPIQTFVCEHNDELVREAITRELARGGQVYYVFNRVNQIAEVAAKIQDMVPDANVAFAHGQMNERELEDIMYDFVNGEIDILVSTTIIETGMDISNVNTLIIQDSDRFGLSQLYQLRGRVGRSNRVAYAFLMYSKNKILTEVAEKRLEAIREFTDLGSGFKIAMRDLEIRGAGNLLGKTQHGHMEAVGYELYCKMLNEAVSKMKGITMDESFNTVINIGVSAYIPQEYIFNEEQKLDMYKRIAGIESEKELGEIKDELIDRFGSLPAPADNLLRISLMRADAHKLYITEVRNADGVISFIFKPDAKLDAAKVPDVMLKVGKNLKFNHYGKPAFLYSYEKETLVEKEEEQLLKLTEQLLDEMKILIPEG